MKGLLLHLFLVLVFISPFASQAQTINGKIMDEEEGSFLPNVPFNINGNEFLTGSSGEFSIKNTYLTDEIDISITVNGFEPYVLQVANEKNSTIELGILFLTISANNGNAELLSVDDLEVFDDTEVVSSMLSAAWDPFSSLVNFNFRVSRFTPRGLNPDHQKIYLNSLPFNNLENGRYFWSLWGGLNDVLRNQYNHHGMNTTDFGVGGFAGLGNIDLRATNQRKGTRISTNYSNRSYRHRIMATHSSGVQSNGWAYTLSASRRWGNQGFIKGTYYDGYSWFLSVDKKINDRHSLNITGLAAPTVRGRATPSTQFVYDLVGDNFYNPNWGFQNGEVRNSREYRTNQPVVTLRHDFKLNELTSVTTAVGVQFGKFGATRIGWLDAADPRPDYYGNLPYENVANLSESDLQSLTNLFNDESNIQLNWDQLYDINRNRQYPVSNPDGTITRQNISAYVIEQQRCDYN